MLGGGAQRCAPNTYDPFDTGWLRLLLLCYIALRGNIFRAFCSFHFARACRIVLTTILFQIITSIIQCERLLHQHFQYAERAFDCLIWIIQFFPFRDVFDSPRPSSTIAFIYTRSRSGRPPERPPHRRRSSYRGHHLSSLSIHRRTGRRFHGSRRYRPPTITDRGHGRRRTFRSFVTTATTFIIFLCVVVPFSLFTLSGTLLSHLHRRQRHRFPSHFILAHALKTPTHAPTTSPPATSPPRSDSRGTRLHHNHSKLRSELRSESTTANDTTKRCTTNDNPRNLRSASTTDGKKKKKKNVSNNRTTTRSDDKAKNKFTNPTLNSKSTTTTPGIQRLITLLLDSGSTLHLIKDKELLENIHTTKEIEIETTASDFKLKEVGSLNSELGAVPLPKSGYYHCPNRIGNILSLAAIAEEYSVVMDTAIEDAFFVIDDSDNYLKFSRRPNGMYGATVGTNDKGSSKNITCGIQTVTENEAKYSALDQQRAKMVRQIQEAMTYPSNKQ